MSSLTFQKIFITLEKTFHKLSYLVIHRLNCECPQRREMEMADKPSVSAVNLMILIRSLAFDEGVGLDMIVVQKLCIAYDVRGVEGLLTLVEKNMVEACERIADDVWEIMENRNYQALERMVLMIRRATTLEFIHKHADRIRQEF
jgi:hypothetical protein